MKYAYDIIKKPIITERSIMGVHVGKRSDIKKAIVTLTADSKKIEIFENMM